MSDEMTFEELCDHHQFVPDEHGIVTLRFGVHIDTFRQMIADVKLLRERYGSVMSLSEVLPDAAHMVALHGRLPVEQRNHRGRK